MKKFLFMLAFLLLPNFILADDDIVFVEGERRIFVRLEFKDGEMELTETSAAALAEVAPMFRDGTIRRYEIHGNFCANVRGSRRNTVLRTETVYQKLVDRGVNGARITSTINVATPMNGTCPHERRVDIMSIDIRPERRSRVAQTETVAPTAPDVSVAGAPGNVNGINDIKDINDLNDINNVPTIAPPAVSEMSQPSTAAAQPAPQGRRTVAVYMAGTEPLAVRGVHGILGGELTRVISSHENFIAVDRTDFILAALEDEHDYQRSGMVDDEQIQALGRQLGVEFLCISNIIAVGNGYYIDTRLVDVVTAEVVRSITATSSLRDGSEKMRVARDIANELVDPDRANRCGHGIETAYDPAHQFCFGGRAYNLCGGSGFNPQTQGCLPNQTIGTRCADGTVVSLGTHCGNHTLSVAVAPVNGGSIIRAPDLQTYSADQTVALSAVANRGFTFAGWAGAQTSSDQSINVTMTRNMPVIAMFRPENNNALITTAFPSNGGTISRSPESDVYQSGEVVRVSATPNRGFEFVGWEGATSETSPTINIMIDEGKTLVAIFRPHLHTLNAVAMPEFGGSVFINGTALAAATTSEFGNIVEVFAQPAQGYIFTGWSGGTSGNTNPTMIDLTNSNVNVIANFAPVRQRIEDENVSRVIAVSGSGAEINVNVMADVSPDWIDQWQQEIADLLQPMTHPETPQVEILPQYFFLAPKWMPPITAETGAGWTLNLEYGIITITRQRGLKLSQRGWWWSLDAGLGLHEKKSEEGTYNWNIDTYDYNTVNFGTAGITFNIGTMYEFSNNIEFAYGGSIGFWGGWGERKPFDYVEEFMTFGIAGPLVRLRWQYFEITYRGLVGYDEYNYIGYLSQLMVGLQFRTANRRGQN